MSDLLRRAVRRRHGLVVAVAAAALSLAGCSSTPGATGTSTSAAGTSTTSTTIAAHWTSCRDVPLATINTVLGLDVTSLEETAERSTSTCGYTAHTSTSPLVVQVVNGATAAEFAKAVAGFKSQGEHPVALRGLGDEAVSVAPSPTSTGPTLTTVMARRDAAQVYVSAPASLAQVSSLVTAVLAKV